MAPELLSGLLDDAALFPPGSAPMREAVPAHAAHERAWYADLLGHFVCPASRLAEHAVALEAASDAGAAAPVAISLIADTGTGGIAEAAAEVGAVPARSLAAIEVPLRGDDLAGAARRAAVAVRDLDGVDPDALDVFVEVPRTRGWEAALDVLAEEGLGAKLRTGGLADGDVPGAAEVAAFARACADRDVDWKATAGLHAAVRGQRDHGFVNLLLAVHAVPGGAADDDVVAVLEERDGERLAAEAAALSAEEAERVRRSFRSFGTCSVLEPVQHLVTLGLLVEGGEAA